VLVGAVMMAAGAISLSAAAAGARPETSASAAAEADSALIKTARIGVRLAPLSILFVLLVMSVPLVTLQPRLGC
jgi:hypothetical protein